MKFCDCDNCRHQECCGGPQYGCVPDYYPEHFGAQGDAPLGLADYDFFLGIADVEGGFAVADHEDDGQGTEASDEHGRHYHYLAGE